MKSETSRIPTYESMSKMQLSHLSTGSYRYNVEGEQNKNKNKMLFWRYVGLKASKL